MVQNLHDVPGTHSDSMTLTALASSAASVTMGCWVAPFKATVTGLRMVSAIAVTGAATNFATFEVRGVNGAATVRGTISLDSGSDLVAGVDVTLASITAFDVAAGDVLTFQYTEEGTGIAAAIGPGAWVVEYEGR